MITNMQGDAERSESSFDPDCKSVSSDECDPEVQAVNFARNANRSLALAADRLDAARITNEGLQQQVLDQGRQIESLTEENQRLTELLGAMNQMQQGMAACGGSSLALVAAGGGQKNETWELGSSMESLRASERENARLLHEYTELESLCASIEARNARLGLEVKTLKRTVDDLRGKLLKEVRDEHELLELRASSDTLATRCAMLTEEKRISDERCAKAESDLAHETDEMFRLKAGWDENSKQSTMRVAALADELAILKQENSDLEHRQVVYVARNASLEESMDQNGKNTLARVIQTGRLIGALREAITVSEELGSLVMQLSQPTPDSQEAWNRCRELQEENQECLVLMYALRIQTDDSDTRATMLGNDVCLATVRLQQAQSANAELAQANAHLVALMQEHNAIVQAMQREQQDIIQLMYAQQMAAHLVVRAAVPRPALPPPAPPVQDNRGPRRQMVAGPRQDPPVQDGPRQGAPVVQNVAVHRAFSYSNSFL